jgi:uncharacterized membrane protein
MKIEDVLKESFEVLKRTWVSMILATMVFAIGSLLIITAPPLLFGIYIMAVKAIRGEEIQVAHIFRGFDFFGTSWIMSILAILAIAVGLVFLILPGLLIAALFIYAIPIAVNERLSAIDSLKKSYILGTSNLSFTIILAIVVWMLGAIGSYTTFGFLLTTPLSVFCVTISALNLTSPRYNKI